MQPPTPDEFEHLRPAALLVGALLRLGRPVAGDAPVPTDFSADHRLVPPEPPRDLVLLQVRRQAPRDLLTLGEHQFLAPHPAPRSVDSSSTRADALTG